MTDSDTVYHHISTSASDIRAGNSDNNVVLLIFVRNGSTPKLIILTPRYAPHEEMV